MEALMGRDARSKYTKKEQWEQGGKSDESGEKFK